MDTNDVLYEQRQAAYWANLARFWTDWATQCAAENEPSSISEHRACVYQSYASAHARIARNIMGV